MEIKDRACKKITFEFYLFIDVWKCTKKFKEFNIDERAYNITIHHDHLIEYEVFTDKINKRQLENIKNYLIDNNAYNILFHESIWHNNN
jgi:hypothetical protein